MSSGRTVWWPKDSAWWRREHVVELAEEFGADGPAVLDWLSCEAKAQNQGGRVKAGYRAVARGCFVELVTVRHAVSRAVAIGALDDFEEDGTRFVCRISGWAKDNDRGHAALRQADARARANVDVEPKPGDEQTVTRRDMSRPVTPRHAESPREEKRREEEKTPPGPPLGGRQRSREEWRNDVIEWGQSVGVTEPPHRVEPHGTYTVKAFERAQPWLSDEPAVAFRLAAERYYSPPLVIGEVAA